MNSRGKSESNVLKNNLQGQIDRLVQQLADIEESKDDLEEDEYQELKKETVEQLNEVTESLKKMDSGDVSLINDINAMQLAIQTAISNAFKTPEVIQHFAKKQPGQLRTHLDSIERDFKIGKLSSGNYLLQKQEILSTLKKLGDKLNPGEETFLSNHGNSTLHDFEAIDDEANSATNMLHAAQKEIQSNNTA